MKSKWLSFLSIGLLFNLFYLLHGAETPIFFRAIKNETPLDLTLKKDDQLIAQLPHGKEITIEKKIELAPFKTGGYAAWYHIYANNKQIATITIKKQENSIRCSINPLPMRLELGITGEYKISPETKALLLSITLQANPLDTTDPLSGSTILFQDLRSSPASKKELSGTPQGSDTQNLRVVSAITNQLQSQPALVIFGAPGSGKTEQMALALAGKSYELFDLRSKFIDQYAKNQGITDQKKQDELKKNYAKLKKEEADWLSKEKEAISKQLLAQNKDIIVFDEFDLWKGGNPNTDELKSMQMILDIAQQLAHQNKKIIFIIHSEGLHATALKDQLAQKFGINFASIIRTAYLAPQEEQFLLKSTNFTDAEKERYITWAQGCPAAYLPLIDALSSGKKISDSIDQLMTQARQTIDKVYRVIKITDPSLAQMAQEIAQGKLSLESSVEKEKLVETGLVGSLNGHYFMAPIVKEQIDIRIQES